MLTKKLAGAPDGKHNDAGTNNEAYAKPEPGAFVPARREFVCSFEKYPVAGQCKAELLVHYLNGVLEQLDFLLPQPDSLAQREHLVLLIQEEPLNTGKVRFVARRDWGGFKA